MYVGKVGCPICAEASAGLRHHLAYVERDVQQRSVDGTHALMSFTSPA